MEQNGLCKGAKLRLRNALLQMLKSTELDKICVTELCRLAEVNRTSFYRYYTLPKEVLQELLEEIAEGIMQVAKLPHDSAVREEAVLRFCRELYDRADIVRTLICRSEHGGSEGEFRDLVTQHVCGAMAGNSGASLRSTTMAAAFFAGGLWRLLRNWLQEENPRPPEEIAKLIQDMLHPERWF